MFDIGEHSVKNLIRKAATGAAVLSVAAAAMICVYGQTAGAAEMQNEDVYAAQAAEAAESAGSGEDSAAAGEDREESTAEESAAAEQDAQAAVPVQEEEVMIGEIREDPPKPLLPYEEAGLSADDWRLVVVNREHEIPEGYEVVTARVDNWQEVDEWVADDLEEMMDDCRDEGYSPYICSGYRTGDKQVSLFEADVRKYRRQGYSDEEARERTAETVAIPGTSEHEMGLAVDIVSYGNQRLERSQEDTGTQQWLMENSWRYGFILRYPEDKEEITGISYEPWHYRYVGQEAAQYMYEHNLCLEEFMGITD